MTHETGTICLALPLADLVEVGRKHENNVLFL